MATLNKLKRETVCSRAQYVGEKDFSHFIADMLKRAGGWNGVLTSDTLDTPFHMLAPILKYHFSASFCKDVLEMAFDEGADPSVRNAANYTPLAQSMVSSHHVPVFVEVFSKKGWDGMERADKGETLLHLLASSYGGWEDFGKPVFESIQSGFKLDVMSLDSNGKSIADVALYYKNASAWYHFAKLGVGLSGMKKAEAYSVGWKGVSFTPDRAISLISKFLVSGNAELEIDGEPFNVETLTKVLGLLPSQNPWSSVLSAYTFYTTDGVFGTGWVHPAVALARTVQGSSKTDKEVIDFIRECGRTAFNGGSPEEIAKLKSEVESMRLATKQISESSLRKTSRTL